jgi:hypothetical protein
VNLRNSGTCSPERLHRESGFGLYTSAVAANHGPKLGMRAMTLERMSAQMTTFDRRAKLGRAAAALAPDPHPHAALTTAVRQAVGRDLTRLVDVLAEPVTAVRRSALIEHAGYVLDQLQGLHRLQDTSIWPIAAANVPDLVDLREQVRRRHFALGEPIGELRHAARVWQRSAAMRQAMRSAVENLASSVAPVLELDDELVPLACSAVPVADWLDIDRRAPRLQHPTRVARRMLWLLDDLDPATASLLVTRRPRATMWALRNCFSGAYNRAAYLMWTGGGTGPAI